MALLYHSLTLTVLLVNENTIETKDKMRKKQKPKQTSQKDTRNTASTPTTTKNREAKNIWWYGNRGVYFRFSHIYGVSVM
jgi:hypothetical protein